MVKKGVGKVGSNQDKSTIKGVGKAYWLKRVLEKLGRIKTSQLLRVLEKRSKLRQVNYYSL